MDPKRNFTEEDHRNLAKFLNLVAKHAKFTMDTPEMLEYVKSLSFMQQVLMKKVEGHILEIKEVVKVEKKEELGKAPSARKAK